jgi:hypothetical protein
MPLRLRRALDRLPNTIPLEVGTDRASYLPGDTAQVVVRAGPAERDLEVDQLVVTLESTVKYMYTAGGGRNQILRNKVDREPADERRITLQGKIAAGEAPEIALPLEVPRASVYPGTGGGTIVKSSWAVTALLGIPNSVDASAQCPVHVLTPRGLYEGRTTHGASREGAVHEIKTVDWMKKSVSGGKQDETLDIQIHIDDPNVAPGDAFTGTVAIHAHESLEAHGIRVELKWHEHVPLGNHENLVTTAERLELHPKRALTAGEDVVLPFEVAVPAGASPTLLAPHGTLSWFLHAVVQRKLRNDFSVSREVNVYDEAPRGS